MFAAVCSLSLSQSVFRHQHWVKTRSPLLNFNESTALTHWGSMQRASAKTYTVVQHKKLNFYCKIMQHFCLLFNMNRVKSAVYPEIVASEGKMIDIVITVKVVNIILNYFAVFWCLISLQTHWCVAQPVFFGSYFICSAVPAQTVVFSVRISVKRQGPKFKKGTTTTCRVVRIAVRGSFCPKVAESGI